MSHKLTTVLALTLYTLVAGCSSDSEPVTSQSSNYEVGGEATSSSGPESQSDAAQIVSGQVPPRRPQPMNQTPAGGAGDNVQPTPDQLLSVIRRLKDQQPTGANQEAMIQNFIDLQSQLVQAVDMLLDLNPDDKVLTEAAEAKINALTAVSQLGAEDAIDQLFAFTKELSNHPSEEISAYGRQQSFMTLLNAFSTGQVTDVQHVVDEYKKLAQEQPKDGGLLAFGRNVAPRLVEKGLNKEAADVLRFTAGLVQPTEDPRLTAAADSLLEQARFADVDFGAKLQAIAEKEEGAVDEFATTVGELTSAEKVGKTTLQTLLQIGGQLEADYGEAAATVYDALESALAKNPDEELVAIIKETVGKYRLRSSIVGQPFYLEGKLIDDTPFDWNQYKGKYVLVDFWATWCGPCLQEMPNIRANFEKYRERGLEVVGVNLDDDMEKLKEFQSLQPLPWPSVLSADPESVGWKHPMVEKYGVAAIPFLVLVDRKGTAIALNTRGPALGEKLAELFPEPTSSSKAPAEPKATDTKPDSDEAATPPEPTTSPAAAEKTDDEAPE